MSRISSATAVESGLGAESARIGRRGFLKALGVAGIGAALPPAGIAAEGGPAKNRRPESELPCLVRSLPEEHSYRPKLSGRIPDGLKGTLYRNGPGIFERDGHRKRCLLDGDGMVQAYSLDEAGAHYANRFVDTPKFREEEEAGRFEYQSWTTVAPGGFLANLGVGEFKGSAGVNAVAWGDTLYALEDASHPYRMDADTLETLGPDRFGVDGAVMGAHPKMDLRRGEWIHTGIGVFDRDLHVTIVDRSGRLVSHRAFEVERGGYVHDCIVTDRYVVVIMSPVALSPLGFIMGRNSVAGSFTWKGGEPNHVYLIERNGGDSLQRIDAPAFWSWHTANAFDRGGEIVADLIAYDEPDHFIGDDPFFWAIMEGRFAPATSPGELRRLVIDPKGGTIRIETLHSGNCEYPTTHPGFQCGEYRYVYCGFVRDLSKGLIHDSVMRIDTHSGDSTSYYLGPDRFCGETVFAPLPGHRYAAGSQREPGWLLSVVYDLAREKSELAIFEAEGLAQGPVATVHLEHHTPFSFHGSWRAA